jgi:hypothetical protein
MTAEQAWLNHKHGCRRCQRQWKRWEDGDMTCGEGVPLLFAALYEADDQALFPLEKP